MGRIPSWAELCMVVDELSRTQKECYDGVHQLLDPGIPELDRKLRYLMSKPNEIPLTTSPVTAPIQAPTHARPKVPAITKISIKDTKSSATNTEAPIATTSAPVLETFQITSTTAPPPPIVNKPPAVCTITTSAPPPSNVMMPAKNKTRRSNGLTTNGPKTSLKDLEHLRPPSKPLCEYLRRNRPDILMNVEARSSYIRKISDERKSLRAYRIVSSLERIRISTKSGKKQQNKQLAPRPPRTMRDFDAPDYRVRCKQSEREMKQLTLRNYRRLPEVKKQKLEEVNKHLKEQYYKNRQLYGRMLLNNFKNGIINYPLRASYEDRSITSSQSEYSMSQSADTACSLDPYY